MRVGGPVGRVAETKFFSSPKPGCSHPTLFLSPPPPPHLAPATLLLFIFAARVRVGHWGR